MVVAAPTLPANTDEALLILSYTICTIMIKLDLMWVFPVTNGQWQFLALNEGANEKSD